MNQKKHFWKGKGFYLALALVVAGAAMASFLAINSMMAKLGAADSAPAAPQSKEDSAWQESKAAVDTKQDNVPVEDSPKDSSVSSAPQKSATSQSVSQAAPSEASEPPAAPAPQYVSPMIGTNLQDFSGDELVYNTTLKDWRTHNGLDIKAAKNDAVKAPANGIVTGVLEDDPRWGNVVEITVEDNTVIRLCGLTNVHVKQGDQVVQDKTIALLGEVPCESEMEPHLHIEMMQGSTYLNPLDHFALNG